MTQLKKLLRGKYIELNALLEKKKKPKITVLSIFLNLEKYKLTQK